MSEILWPRSAMHYGYGTLMAPGTVVHVMFQLLLEFRTYSLTVPSLELHVLVMLFLGAAFAAAFALSPMAGVAPC
jgi:hypothetical protein